VNQRLNTPRNGRASPASCDRRRRSSGNRSPSCPRWSDYWVALWAGKSGDHRTTVCVGPDLCFLWWISGKSIARWATTRRSR
jgi:hypothetical protein